MSVSADNSLQIKRDLDTLINHYSATYSNNAEYADRLYQYHRQIITIEKTQPHFLVLGQLGLGLGAEILSLWLTQLSIPSAPRVLLKVFEPTPTCNYELKRLWDQLGLLANKHPLSALASRFLKACPVDIINCQRLSFDDGNFIVDLHFGEPLKQLQLLPCQHNQLIHHWLIHDGINATGLSEKLAWQMAKTSDDSATYFLTCEQAELNTMLKKVGFNDAMDSLHSPKIDPILAQERSSLRHAQYQQYCYSPLAHKLARDPADAAMTNADLVGEQKTSLVSGKKPAQIAIIGGGLASANLALSLAQRQQAVQLFCQDSDIGQGASGNKQGAIYPLLTPENSPLSRFFQQAFLFSRRRIEALVDHGYSISHNFCGVLQTGHDERSTARLNKIIEGQKWPQKIARHVSAEEANQIAGVTIDKAGFFYPLGGWVCPYEYARAALAHAATLSDVQCTFDCHIDDIIEQQGQWYVVQGNIRHGPFTQLILANGAQLTQYKQTSQLQATPFRGQVSHVPQRPQLSRLSTVLCANGYLTPSDKQFHCAGASYVKEAPHLEYCPYEQLENLHKMQQSYEGQAWIDDIDIRGHDARVGVRMVTRDHFPMMGCAPDVEEIYRRYQTHQCTKASAQYWQNTPAPVIPRLFILGALGSRGLSSGPLAAECLAAQLCNELPPLDIETLSLLNPNRMWLRKLIKGKALG